MCIYIYINICVCTYIYTLVYVLGPPRPHTPALLENRRKDGVSVSLVLRSEGQRVQRSQSPKSKSPRCSGLMVDRSGLLVF